MREYLATNGSAEIGYQLVFLRMEDEREELATAAAIAKAIAGGGG